jgi:LacI family transcriptional regulator
VDCVVIGQNDFDGGRQIGDHLVATGCRNCWMTVPRTEWAAIQSRLAGVSASLEKAGLPPPTLIRCDDESFPVNYEATLAALRQGPRPDAIIGGNDQMAIAAMKACIDFGISVPDEVQVTGFNAFEMWRYVDPPLTTVQSAAKALGERAGAELIARLQSGHFATREIVLPVTLQLGRSTRSAEGPG